MIPCGLQVLSRRRDEEKPSYIYMAHLDAVIDIDTAAGRLTRLLGRPL
jgi:hypothetical protein